MIPKSADTDLRPQRVAVMAGSFNPFTIGHADIVQRGLDIFDHVAICIGVNANKPDDARAASRRTELLESLYAGNQRVSVHCWDGLMADFAKKIGACALLRGVRSVKDYEYERDMADANRAVFGLDTVILFADPCKAYVTSSLVRELEKYGVDISPLLP